jgi:hypothetical protein
LLVEPQRTNLALYSEDFTDLTNWFPTNVTTTANTTISPDGTLNADTANFGAGANGLNSGNTFAGNSDVTISVFVKAGSISIFRIRESFYIGSSCVFDLTAKTAGAGGRIEEYPNGWFRCSFTYNLGVGQTNINWIFDSNTAAGTLFLWGAQTEAASTASSYIKTEASTVTRVADVVSKTGASSLIGQTEGTLFVDVNQGSLQEGGRYQIISDGSLSNRIVIYNSLNVINVFCSAGATFNLTYNPPSGRLKIAFAYKSGLYSLFVNGIERATSAEAAVPTGLSVTGLGVNEGTLAAESPSIGYNAAALLPTRLSNAQLAALTTL